MGRWLLLGVLITLAGCAAAPVQEKAGDLPASGEATFELHARSYAFFPVHLTVPAGKPLVLRVQDEATFIPHSFVLEKEGAGIIVRRQLRKGGETLIHIAPLSAGKYVFYCDESFMGISHRKKGMEGTLEAIAGQ